MQDLTNDAFLDDSGQLHLMRPGVPDAFAPPGTAVPDVLKATGFFYDRVPTYGWPLGIIYQNNPLQFASSSTASRMLDEVTERFPLYYANPSVDEVKVGPFTRAAIRQVAISDDQGLIVKLNAGEMANQLARYPDGWTARIERAIIQGKRKRDTE